jgi:opacity protein-like surface antigen
MRNAKKVTMVLAVLTVGLVCSSVYGQEEITYGDKWQISFTPYFFAPDMKGESTVAGATAKIDVGFTDIIDNFDVFALMGRVEAWKGDWGFFFDGMYLDLDGDFTLTAPAPRISIDADIRESILDFGMAYKLFKVPLEENRSRMLTFEPLGGVRYHYLKQEMKLSVTHPKGAAGTTLGGDEEWVEPFVGARLTYDLTEKLAAGVRTDFGGFGIGSASKLTWNLVAGIDWEFRKNMSFKAGYRVLDIDYSRHSGSSEFGFDAKMQGPIITLRILF